MKRGCGLAALRGMGWFAIVFAMALCASGAVSPAAQRGRERLSLDFDWRFSLGDPTNASSQAFDDSKWRKVNIPHDWSIEGPFSESNKAGKAGGYAPLGVGWYRRSFYLLPEEAGKKVFLSFDGVFAQADVWVNGKKVG